MKSIDDFFSLFVKLDREESLEAKIELIEERTKKLQGASDVNILWFCSSECDASAGIHFIPLEFARFFPEKPQVFDKQFILPEKVPKKEFFSATSVYYPFSTHKGRLQGALVIGCGHPESFLKTHLPVLGLLSSKIKDTLETGFLLQKVKTLANFPDFKYGTPMSSEITGMLMAQLDFPVYITDRKNNFHYANKTFLNQFQIKTLENLQSNGSFFLEPEIIFDGIKKLENGSRVVKYSTKINTGKNRTLVVHNSATLINNKVFGVIFDVTKFAGESEDLQNSLLLQQNLAEKLESATTLLEKTQASTLKSLAHLAEYRDMETGNHLLRIREYVILLGRELLRRQPYSFSLSEKYIEDLYISCMLHDIGKVGVPDNILLKQESLTEKEHKIMEFHTIWGWTILNQADEEIGEQSYLTLAANIALHHHEKYNGTGYPYGLKEDAISLSARITTVADVYDSLRSKRPYKKAWDHKAAINKIITLKGKDFDPILVDILVDIQDEIQSVEEKIPD